MSGIKVSQVAYSTPFDNSTNGFDSTNVQSAIEEIGAAASPGFSWGRSGALFASSWLQNEGINSNIVGRFIPLATPTIAQIFVSNQTVSTYQVTIYMHDGDSTNLTTVTTVTVTNSRGGVVNVDIPITQGRQLAVRLTSGNASNILVGVIIKGKSQ